MQGEIDGRGRSLEFTSKELIETRLERKPPVITQHAVMLNFKEICLCIPVYLIEVFTRVKHCKNKRTEITKVHI